MLVLRIGWGGRSQGTGGTGVRVARLRVARVRVSSHQILDRRPSSLPCFLTAVPNGHLLPEPELLPVSAPAAALSLEQGPVW